MAAAPTQTPSTQIRLPQSGLSLIWLFGLLLLLLGLLVLDIALGSVGIPLSEVAASLLGQPLGNEVHAQIIWLIRVPKAFTAVLAGCCLAVAGLQMQTLFRNPLAGPSVLGITAGASLGVAVLMLGAGAFSSMEAIRQLNAAGSWGIVLASTAGSALIFWLIIGISLRITDNVVLLIVGIMIANVTIALVSIWQYFSSPEQIRDYLLWTFGSLGGVNYPQLQVLAIVSLLGAFFTFGLAKYLNLLLLGEAYARSMGLNLKAVKVSVIFTSSLLAGAVTGFCGPIGFVGLAVPHLCRALLNTADHRTLIPACCLMGACVMLGCDIIAQLPGHASTLPINAVTALLGSPIVVWVVLKKNNLKAAF